MQSISLKNDNKVNVLLFCGGSGSKSIINSLKNHPQIKLNVILNAYDDGKSTGYLRDFIPGMLGPSDIRKNISNALNNNVPHEKSLNDLIEYRFPVSTDIKEGLKFLKNIFQKDLNDDLFKTFKPLNNIKFKHFNASKKYINNFINYFEKKIPFNDFFSDCSLGNIIFAGCYLENNKNFNLTIKTLLRDFEIKMNILNVTNGDNIYLSGIRFNNTLCLSESEVIEKSNFGIKEIFLTDKKLDSSFIKSQKELEYIDKNPKINLDLINLLGSADLIIYGPGTQNSSLFPTYLTESLGEIISKNFSATKVFICNIIEDHDILDQSTNEILEKFIFYMNLKKNKIININELITDLFVQKKNNDKTYITLNDTKILKENKITIKELDWEMSGGEHAQSVLCSEIINLIQLKSLEKIKDTYHLVSIIIPSLNEVNTIQKVLDNLRNIDFFDLTLNKEIICVDGGSNDGTIDIIKKNKDIKSILMPYGTKRGECLKKGIEESKGNIIIFFPSDNEYDVNDIKTLIETYLLNQNSAIIGSRAIRSINLKENINHIYQNKKSLYYISKIGGALISFLMIIKNNVYLSDLLSSVKVFSKKDIYDIKTKKKGFDFDIELIINLIRKGSFIIEVPVKYNPRSKKNGKKITIMDGLSVVKEILFS